MASTEQSVVIGIIEEREAAAQAIKTLLQAGFDKEQIGFVARSSQEHIEKAVEDNNSAREHGVMRGIVGGIMGALDLLIMPFTGPADASTMLAASLPATEGFIGRFNTHHRTGPLVEKSEPASSAAETPAEQEEEKEYHRIQSNTSTITGSVVGGVMGAAAAALIPGIGPVIAGGILVAALALGGTAGSFLGAFEDMGVPRHKAHQYEQEIKAGRTIITIQAAGRQEEAVELLRQSGAHDIERV